MLGLKLKTLRQDRGLSLKEASNDLQITIGALSNYERDTRTPDLKTLVLLADYYEVSTDYLLGRTVSEFSDKRLTSMFDDMEEDLKGLTQEQLSIVQTNVHKAHMSIMNNIRTGNRDTLDRLILLYDLILGYQLTCCEFMTRQAKNDYKLSSITMAYRQRINLINDTLFRLSEEYMKIVEFIQGQED